MIDTPFRDLGPTGDFLRRHIGPSSIDMAEMLDTLVPPQWTT